MQVVGYCRVSTARQALEGVSLDAQRQRIADWCRMNGHDLVATYADEGLSGKRADNRPELQKALDHACRDKAIFVAYSLSRVGRSLDDLRGISKRLDKAGAGFVSLTENLDTTSPVGRLVFTMIAAFAEFEREMICERVKGAMAYGRSQGNRQSRFAPMGWTLSEDGRSLVKDAQEQKVVQKVQHLAREGLGAKAIWSRLVESGIVGRLGKPWSVTAIKRAVKV